MKLLDDQIQDERIEGIWRQLLDVFRGGILADWFVFWSLSYISVSLSYPFSSSIESFPLDVQETEENFDLSLVASLEIDVVPHLGGSRIPDNLVATLGKILQKGSKIYEDEQVASSRSSSASDDTAPSPPSSSESQPKNGASLANPGSPSKLQGIALDMHYSDIGSTDFGTLLPRERFSYWCFDLLFLICSDVTKGKNVSTSSMVIFDELP